MKSKPNQSIHLFQFSHKDLTNGSDINTLTPRVDYTPPSYITLLFTDIGVLTPAAVSDRLIKLYL